MFLEFLLKLVYFVKVPWQTQKYIRFHDYKNVEEHWFTQNCYCKSNRAPNIFIFYSRQHILLYDQTFFSMGYV